MNDDEHFLTQIRKVGLSNAEIPQDAKYIAAMLVENLSRSGSLLGHRALGQPLSRPQEWITTEEIAG